MTECQCTNYQIAGILGGGKFSRNRSITELIHRFIIRATQDSLHCEKHEKYPVYSIAF